ncbi:MAG: DUF3048 domain-containing protein [Firmicutes bacterium]|nr:DUF3048 domain-containing protein [Bacillota bacterium]
MKRSIWASLIAAGSASLLAACGSHATPSAKPTTTHPQAQTSSPAPASGNVDPLTDLASPQHGPLVALMIENSEYGRPQYGLSSADVVYEAYTEFFYYPRFLLLYYGHAPKLAGPDRSARPYFVSLVHQWPGAAYFHAGASTPAYTTITQDNIHNMDLDANAYNLGTRVSFRPAPHNLFTNIGTDMQAAQKIWGNSGVKAPWPFVSHVTSGTPKDTSITLSWNSHNSVEQWRWDSQAQGWTRWVDNPDAGTGFQQVMGMNSGKPVLAGNVIIEYTNEQYLYDPAHTGWIQIQTHGQGNALLFLGHRQYSGTWKNAGPGQPTKFYLPNGQLAPFNPGPTWIELVPNSQSAANSFKLTLQ